MLNLVPVMNGEDDAILLVSMENIFKTTAGTMFIFFIRKIEISNLSLAYPLEGETKNC